MAAARKTAAAKTTTRKAATPRKAAAKRPARKTPAKKAAKSVTKPPAEKRPGPGRPPLLEIKPELQRQIVTFVRSGAFPERAALAVGVSERSHYAWMKLGRDELDARDAGEKPDPAAQVYVDYAEAIERAVAEAEMLLMGNALKGGATGSASMSILQRRFRERWGDKAPPPAAAPAPTTTGPATGLDQLEQRRREREQAAR
jgi:hypothetical protein